LADTTYTDNVTVLTADTMNDLNRLHYTILADPASLAAAQSNLMIASKGGLAGGAMSNGTDATNDIDVAAGQALDSTGAVRITWSALTKRLDAAWAVGTAQGGRDTGSIADGTWHVYAIKKDSDLSGDILFSTSASSPTMPSGYTYFRRIGSILRESAAIVGFVQDGDYFRRKASVLSVSDANPGTSAVSYAMDVPLGINVFAVVNVYAVDSTPAGFQGLLSDLAADDEAPSATVAPLGNFRGVSAGEGVGVELRIRTNTSGEVRSRLNASTANTSVKIATVGWIDRRGRD
jgi:hypothetical protein